MNKIKIFLYFFLLNIVSLSFTWSQVEIRDISVMEYYDLRGEDGFNGRNGFHANSPICENGEVRDGLDGENGSNGEPGTKGSDVYVYLDNANDLRKLRLDLRGGSGGRGGRGGRGSDGCNGGFRGQSGKPGLDGIDGAYGRIYLLNPDFRIPIVRNTKLVHLTDLYRAPIKLSENLWEKHEGAKDIFHSSSKISNEYYRFKNQVEYTVSLDWQVPGDIHRFDDIKMAINVENEKLEVKTYNGGLLVYNIERELNHFIISIIQVYEEYRFRNLKLKKLRGHGQSLTLEVREKFSPMSVQVGTKFVLSIKKISQNVMEHNETRYYEIPNSLVSKREKSYFINIGMLKFPESLKQKGIKLRIQLTIYRELPGQTRVQGLEGIFKI